MANGLKEMVVQLLSIKDGAFEEIRALWKDYLDTTGVGTVGELFEKFEKEKGHMLSAEDVKELLESLAYVDIKEKVFANDAPWRSQINSSSISTGISASMESAPDGAQALMVTGRTAVPVSNWVMSSPDIARRQTLREGKEALRAKLGSQEESLEREIGLHRTLHGQNRYLQEKLKEQEELLGEKNVEIRSLKQRLSAASRAGYHRTSFDYVATPGLANLGSNSSGAPTSGDELNLAVKEGRVVKAPVINQFKESQWQTSTQDFSVQKLIEENAVLKTQLRSQEESSEVCLKEKEGLIEQLKSQNIPQELKLKEKDEKVVQLKRTCDEYRKVIQQVETEKESQRRVFGEQLQQMERVTKVKCEEIKNLNQGLSEAGNRCDIAEKELRNKDDIIKQLSAECQQLRDYRKQDHEKFEQQMQQKKGEFQAENESLLRQLDNFHLTQRTAWEAGLVNQAEQAIAELKRQYEEKLQQMERVARENCALHQQPEERSWIVPRHEVVVYREQEPLGCNSGGIVYRGWFGGGPVAVKELHGAIDSPHNRRLFYREMEMLSRVRHKNLVQLMAGVFDDGLPLIVTEVANCSLEMMLENRALQPCESFRITSDVAQGILYLHRHPVPMIHGDIKTGNVLVFQIGQPPGILAKICDMGNANFVYGVEAPNPVSPEYSPPETQQFTTKNDVYRFGLVAMVMNIREPPVAREIQRQVEQVTNTFMQRLIKRCTATNPDDRPDMERVVHELEQCELNDTSHGFN